MAGATEAGESNTGFYGVLQCFAFRCPRCGMTDLLAIPESGFDIRFQFTQRDAANLHRVHKVSRAYEGWTDHVFKREWTTGGGTGTQPSRWIDLTNNRVLER